MLPTEEIDHLMETVDEAISLAAEGKVGEGIVAFLTVEPAPSYFRRSVDLGGKSWSVVGSKPATTTLPLTASASPTLGHLTPCRERTIPQPQ